MTNVDIKKEIGISLRETQILSILTYSVRLFPISNNILTKTQSFCSKCQRAVTIGPYREIIKLPTLQYGATHRRRRLKA